MQQSEEDPSATESRPTWLQGSSEAGYLTNSDADFSTTRSAVVDGDRLPLLQRAQSVSNVISLILSPLAIILVSAWASNLGGVSWKQGEAGKVFNWHPVMMVTAYAVMNVGALIFRVSGTSAYQASLQGASSVSLDSKKRGIVKVTHASTWSLTIIFGIVAMLAVFKSHNDPVSGYIANLYSLHSWVGILVMSLYTLQFIVGLVAFLSGRSGRSRLGNPMLMEIHKYTGAYIHILATATILLGIQEKEGFVSCGYSVTSPDLMPILNYGKIPHSCKISHGLGTGTGRRRR